MLSGISAAKRNVRLDHTQSLVSNRHITITLLLTKFTILFLPASLVMAYFSVPLGNAEYTLGQFWGSFSVVFVLSLAALVGFGISTGSLQTGWVWRLVVKGAKGTARWVERVV